MLVFCTGMALGIILGVTIMAMMSVSRNCSMLEEAYYKGFEDGKATNNN